MVCDGVDVDAPIAADEPRQRGRRRANQVDLTIFCGQRPRMKQHAWAAAEITKHDDDGFHAAMASRRRSCPT